MPKIRQDNLLIAQKWLQGSPVLRRWGKERWEKETKANAVEIMRILKTKSNENALNHTSSFIVLLLSPHSTSSDQACPLLSIKCAIIYNHS